MKFDPQKAFPYPVLRPYSDDYKGAEFQVVVEYSSEAESKYIDFEITYTISSPEIFGEIKKGNAVFVSLISCRDTYFRFVLESSTNKVNKSFDKNNLRGEVKILSYVVAKNDIESFQSPDINTEFGPGPFKFDIGDVLAQDETYMFYIERDLFKPVTSVFDLVKRDTLIGSEWNLEFEQDHIRIVVSPEMKEKIDNARNSTPNRAILLNSIYFAAVQEAVSILKQDDSSFEDFKWAKVLRRQAHNKNIDFQGHLSYLVAQKLMQFPLSLLDTYIFKES